jgi:peptide/nickel transport system substrate-binding protein
MRSILAGIKYIPHLRLSVFRKVFSLMGRSERIGVAVLLVIAFVSGFMVWQKFYVAHTNLVPAFGGSYREGILGQPKLINPILSSNQVDASIARLIFSGLYKYDANGNVVPDLAEGMPAISKNEKEYTVKLRTNAKWHNDKPVTSDDVIFTIDTIKDGSYKSPYRAEWSNTSVEKVDDYTLVFVNEDVSGPFLHNLTQPIISKSIWENVTPETFATSGANLEAIGTGPYLIRSIKKLPDNHVESMVLESFSNYYGGKPNIDNVEFLFYENDEDILNALHSREITGFGFLPFDRKIYLERDRKNISIHELPLPQYQAAFLNFANKLMQDKRIRKALSLGTDRQAVIDETINGYGRIISGPILPEQADLGNEVKPSFDIAQANSLLDEAGWVRNSNTKIREKAGQQLEFTLATNDFSGNVKTAELLIQNWSKLGVKINLNILPTAELTNNVIRPRKFDILVFSHKIGADPDPFLFWHSSQTVNPGLNLTGFSVPLADQLIAEARTTTDKKIRDDKYRQFQNIIIEEVPAIFLNQSLYIYAVSTDIQNFTTQSLLDPTYRFYDLTNWYVKQRRVWK